MNRRNLLSTTALVAAGSVALAACTSASANASVQSVFNAIQFVLPLVDVLALGISVAVPAAAPILAVVTPYLNSAGTVFQTLSATMTTISAQPIVQQIEGYVAGAVTAVDKVVSTPGAAPALAAFQPKVAQAQAVVALLTAFVNGVTTAPTAAMIPTVSLPLLHR